MRENQVFFSGIAWPSVRMTGRHVNMEPRGLDLEPSVIISVETSGNGRRWETDEPMGFWRTFAELDLDSDTEVLEFYRRYGDPDGWLLTGNKSHTGGWHARKRLLATMAGVWGPPTGELRSSDSRVESAEGISGHNSRHVELGLPIEGPIFFGDEVTNLFQEHLARSLVTYIPTGQRIACMSLSDYMEISAMEMHFEQTSMRKCDVCGYWYGLRRSTAKVCSATCRNIKSRQNRESRDGARQ